MDGKPLLWIWGWLAVMHNSGGQSCLVRLKVFILKVKYASKRLACSGPSHGWVCLTGLYWLGKDSGLGGWYPVVASQAKRTFGLQWTKGGMWTSCQWQSRNVRQLGIRCDWLQCQLRAVLSEGGDFCQHQLTRRAQPEECGTWGDKVELICRLCRQASKVQSCWKLAVSFGQAPKQIMIDFLTNSGSRKQQWQSCEYRVRTESSYLVDPASSHMLVSKIKPCMSKYKWDYTVKLRMAH